MSDKPPVILLVEDDVNTTKMVKTLLERMGYKVEWAANGAMAMMLLSRLEKTPVDLVVMDIYLPGMSGDGLVRHIRHLPGWNVVPIVVCTGEQQEIVRGMLGGSIDDFIAKPINAASFLELVKKFIKQVPTPPAPPKPSATKPLAAL